MKKIYLLVCLVMGFSLSTEAQIIEDDFESYTTGPMVNQNPTVWRTWAAGHLASESMTIVTNNARSGTQSGYMGMGPGPQDVVLQLGNLTSGTYTVEWYMYIPTGATGYINVQGQIPAAGVGMQGVFNSSNIYFNETGATPGVGADMTRNPPEAFTYPENTWFPVSFFFNLNASTYLMSVDNAPVNLTPVPFQADNTLGGINFYSVNTNNEYWVDDVIFVQGTLSNEDFVNTSFKVYPNPVVNELNIKSKDLVSSVSIYNVLGKLVSQSKPESLFSKIDMSNLQSGVYFVEVTIGNSKKTVKVLK